MEDQSHFSRSDLHLVSEAALTYLDLDDLLHELLERITEILDADTAAILLVDDDALVRLSDLAHVDDDAVVEQ